MNSGIVKINFRSQLSACARVVCVTMGICSLLYSLVILGIGKVVTPGTADGSLIRSSEGKIIGSRLIAQSFTRPDYFWPRPSAANYDAAASGGSNLSPANPELSKRAGEIIKGMAGDPAVKIPADLVTASGSGLDPHITLASAEYQAERVAKARGISIDRVRVLLGNSAHRSGGALASEPLVNVLLINMALDRPEE